MLVDKVELEFKGPIYFVSEHHIGNSSAKPRTRCPPLSSPFVARDTGATEVLSSPTRDLSSEQLETARREARLSPRDATSCCSLAN